MGMPVRINDALYEQARAEALVEHRTIAEQIEYWATIGRASLDNPDLPVSFVAEALASKREPRDQATPFVPRKRRA
ncbi:MAG: ParD-like family protein [Candidatus Nitrotoga sp.]